VLLVRYELGIYVPEDGILHSHRRENLKSYILNYHFRFKPFSFISSSLLSLSLPVRFS
jgi:hypothetical protein